MARDGWLLLLALGVLAILVAMTVLDAYVERRRRLARNRSRDLERRLRPYTLDEGP